MFEFMHMFADTVLSTARDVTPIVAILVVFQVVVLRQRLPNLRRIALGAVFVLLGLTLFLIGLQEALFPIGRTMAVQLTAPEAIGAERMADGVQWHDYLLVYAFAAAIGFATTVAEPSLIAVALKAEEVSGGTVRAWELRIAVAVGVAVGVALGCFPHRHRNSSALVHHRGIHSRDCADLPLQSNHRAARLRQRRCHDRDGNRAGGGGTGAGASGQRAGPQSPYRWIRTHSFRQRLSNHVRAGLRDRRILAETPAEQ